MKSPATWITAALVILAIFGYFIANYSQNVSDTELSSTEASAVGMAASPIFRLILPDSAGRLHALQQWHGKILVVNYWATWCPPCREEMPGFSRLQDKFGSKGVQFIGLSIDTAIKVTEFQKETPVNYPLLIGDLSTINSSVALGNSNQALPFTAVIDRQGTVSSVRLGRMGEADLERQLIGLISR